jgi:hypothetical protein
VHSEPFVVRIPLQSTPAEWRSARATCAAVQDLLNTLATTIAGIVTARLDAIASDVLPTHRSLVSALRDREIAIAQSPSSAARAVVQAGLFDRRALRDAEREDTVRGRRSEDSDQTLRALAAAEIVTPAAALEAVLIKIDGHR